MNILTYFIMMTFSYNFFVIYSVMFLELITSLITVHGKMIILYGYKYLNTSKLNFILLNLILKI